MSSPGSVPYDKNRYKWWHNRRARISSAFRYWYRAHEASGGGNGNTKPKRRKRKA